VFSETGAFTCNLCGQENILKPTHYENPELPSCSGCCSNVRFRWLVHRLSRELFGRSIPLFQFPCDKSIKGIGLTDPGVIAARLVESFTYRNTYYDNDPRLDIRFDPSPFGELDFLIASEVFEHIEPPVGQAFQNTARLLKPSGILLLTVPWVWGGGMNQALPELYDWKLDREEDRWVIVNRNPYGQIERFYDMAFDGGPGPSLGNSREHFPELFDWKLSVQEGVWRLLNRRRNGTIETFHNLVFHEGPGLALEMRLFTKEGLEHDLRAAGFNNIEFETEDCAELGIIFPYCWSRPILARRTGMAIFATP
jgi:SAM-dependent methyltransferase